MNHKVYEKSKVWKNTQKDMEKLYSGTSFKKKMSA